MPSITFPNITRILPEPTTGVALNANIVFRVMIPPTYQGGNVYAYPDIEAMRKSEGELRQYIGNYALNGGYGIVRVRVSQTDTLELPADNNNGKGLYPNDWGFQANFGEKIPVYVNYCDAEGRVVSEFDVMNSIANGNLVCHILFNPVNDFGLETRYNALIDSVLPFKTITVDYSIPEGVGIPNDL